MLGIIVGGLLGTAIAVLIVIVSGTESVLVEILLGSGLSLFGARIGGFVGGG